MKWSFWIELYIRTHCVARGLRPLTLAAYEDALQQFHEWVRVTRGDMPCLLYTSPSPRDCS